MLSFLTLPLLLRGMMLFDMEAKRSREVMLVNQMLESTRVTLEFS